MRIKETVNTKIVKDWIANNDPQGLEKLAVNGCVAASTIRGLLKGKVPQMSSMRRTLSMALNVPESDLIQRVMKT